MSMRKSLIVILATMLLAGCAQNAVRHSDNKKPEPGAFIDRSVIYYPKSGDNFELVKEHTYSDVSAGIQLTYKADDLPDAKIDIFVYPIGDVSREQALARDVNDVRAGVKGMAERGIYSDVKFGELSDFNPSIEDGKHLRGKRLLLRFVHNGSPMASAAYLAYKQLYLLELRITAPADAAQALKDVGDSIATEIFPKIHILNEGTCAVLRMPSGGDSDQIQEALIAGFQHISEISCVTDFTPDNFKPGENEGLQVLKFQSDDWN